jgi:DMSO/TMAO reductase YedYZ molybdopterin-dependent catalytic subunit
MGQLESGPQFDSDVENKSAEEKSGSEETEATQNTDSNTNDENFNKAISNKEATLKALKKKGKSTPSDTASRVPPGQKLSKKWPVMDIGKIPKLDLDTWQLTITGLVDEPITLSFDELKKIGVKKFTTDFHCVTTWSKLDMNWAGVSMIDLIKFVNPKPEWKYLIQYGADDYTTNIRREDVEREDCFIAFEYEGEPLSAEHGGIRMIIPHLYGWKGSKFLVKLEFVKKDNPGFWERRGYHNVAEAFAEERYSEN